MHCCCPVVSTANAESHRRQRAVINCCLNLCPPHAHRRPLTRMDIHPWATIWRYPMVVVHGHTWAPKGVPCVDMPADMIVDMSMDACCMMGRPMDTSTDKSAWTPMEIHHGHPWAYPWAHPRARPRARPRAPMDTSMEIPLLSMGVHDGRP